MAAVQEPEVQFAQRLASNEKPIRTRAMKKLRKYISVRSQRDTGGFTGDELLKLWKGLFYCLWMQDKPLLQEELSNQISSLLHNFQTVDGQFLYLESFLQTFKREWTGIDRLRMDKFFQLVRFMFRQTFEMLKRKNWDSSLVGRFLELLTAQLLHSSSEAPSGLQFHVLDLYMTELAVVGSQELTADQNLVFIEPFCKTAAKTKDGILFRAICNSIFSTIIDQAPFAIDDLMKELKGAEASDSDSGQASDEEEDDDEEEQLKEKTVSKPASKKRTGKQINGKKSNDDEDEDDYDDDDDEDDDELLHLEDSDTEAPGDDDVGPVLQFDYVALADRLFELASRSNTPSQNRQRLYKIIKVLRDLSEGIFPQDEYPEEVSTDEDDDSFGSRKRMKRRGRRTEEDEEGTPASKKRKKKEAAALDKQDEDSAKDDSEPVDLTANTENQKKKRKKKKKKKKAEQGGGEGGENAEQEQMVIKETEVSQTQSSVSSVKVTQAATPEGQPETLLVSEVKKQPSVTVTEETSQPETSQTPAEVSSDAADAAVAGKKKKKKRAGQAGGEGGENTETSEQTQSSISSVKVTEAEDPPITEETSQPTPEEQSEKVEPAGEQQMTAEVSSDSDATVSGKKKKKKKKGLKLETDVAESQVSAEAEPIKSEEPTPATDVTTPAKKKKGLNVEKNLEETEAESQVNGVNTDAGVPSKPEDSAEDGPTSGLETQTDSATPAKKKSKKKNLKTDEAAKVEVEAEIPSAGEDAATTPLMKKTKKKDKQEDTTLEAPAAADESSATPLKKKKRKNNLKESVEEDGAAADAVEPSVAMTTPAKKKKKKPAAAKMGEIKDQDDSEVVSSSGKVAKKKKRKIPIVFEYEADELEAAASINGLAEEEETAVKKTKLDGGEPSTPLSTKKSQKKAKTPSGSTSDFITFQSNATVPTPLFCKTKGGLSTPLSGKKKNQTPKSESKKVTFGLKNNKTAEFRKTDRSLLVSPDGSSRVPFDPKQKPKFGVLKSPATPLSTRAKKTPKGPKKTGSSTPKSTPKRRPSAADFF